MWVESMPPFTLVHVWVHLGSPSCFYLIAHLVFIIYIESLTQSANI
ncbi:hypothetical protein Lalb_Chr09g0324011 [Lupinus albus]|uniref:Uncharacterized protein n=1 Tax=Lupinus albus TaxID=3870 RepID=A0A6A4PYT2_LUPAL|nr:hypothetical protein Lalb_Chr09g0324011 [Lupinus albus]